MARMRMGDKGITVLETGAGPRGGTHIYPTFIAHPVDIYDINVQDGKTPSASSNVKSFPSFCRFQNTVSGSVCPHTAVLWFQVTYVVALLLRMLD